MPEKTATQLQKDALLVRVETMIARLEVIHKLDHNHPLWRDADKLSRRLVVLGELLFDGAGELASVMGRMTNGTETAEPEQRGPDPGQSG